MGIIIRQSFKGSIVTYSGAFIGAVTTVFFYPYFLSPELIGLTRVLTDSAMFIAFFALMGMPNAIVKFHSSLDHPNYKSFYRQLLIFVPLLGFSLIAGLLLLFKDELVTYFSVKSPLFTEYFYYLFPFALFFVYLTAFETYASALKRITITRIFKEIILRVFLVSAVLIYVYFYPSTTIYVLSIVMGYGIIALLNAIYSHHLTHTLIASSDVKEKPDKTLLKTIMSYMLFMFLVNICSNVVVRVDSLMITSMLGLEKVGIYSIAFFISTMIEIPSRVSFQIAAPLISKEMAHGNLTTVNDIYKKNSLNQTIISGFILLIIWCNIENIFTLIPKGAIYKEGIYVVLFIGLGKLIDAVTGINNMIVVYSKYYRVLLLFVFLLAILIVGGNLLFIPLYGINGAALSSLLGYLIINTVTVIFLYNKLGLFPFEKKIVPVSMMFGGLLLVNYLIPVFSSLWLDIVVRNGVIVILFLFILLRYNLSHEISETLTKLKDFKNFIYGR